MQDRIPANPGRVLITPEDGGAAFYATVTRADNPSQKGTPLNKASLLTDATAGKFGLSAETTPNDVFAWLGKYNEHWWRIVEGGTEYLSHSDQRNAYPDFGTEGGVTFEYKGIPFQNFVTAPKMATGTYVGTGTSGSSNPNSLQFDFEPRLLVVSGIAEYPSYSYMGIMLVPSGIGFSLYKKGDPSELSVSSANGCVKWWCGLTDSQLNQSGVTYSYIAIG